MLLIKSSKLNKNIKILSFLIFIFFVFTKTSIANESVDIWSQSTTNKSENSEKSLPEIKDENKINFSKLKNESIKEIEIVENKEEENFQVRLAGLYDPQENNLNLDMWSNTDGENIRNTFNRISQH